MFNRKDYVVIMAGDYTQLNWVCRFLRLSGVAATVKLNSLYSDSYLIVEASKERSARILANEYVESCNRQRLIQIQMKEVFNFGDDESSVV